MTSKTYYKEKFINNISKNKLWVPPNDPNLYEIDEDYIVYESLPCNTTSVPTTIKFDNVITDKENIKVIKVILKPNDLQKQIFQKWFDNYIKMYNVAIRVIKRIHSHRKHHVVPNNLDWKDIRNLSHVKSMKALIMHTKHIYDHNDKWFDTTIGSHEIDLAVKLAVENYKSACSNLKAGNIKHFKLRFWKLTKKIKIMDLEATNFTKNGIRHRVLGHIKSSHKDGPFKFETIKHECQLRYNDFDKSYILYVPINYSDDKKPKNNNLISLDPGIRTFMSGISDSKVIEIGGNYRPNREIRVVKRPYGAKMIKINRHEKYADKIVKKLKQIDRYNSNRLNVIPELKRKKLVDRCHKKIKNYVNELHWKSINYITKNYNTVLVGDMSSKHIGSNDTSVLQSMAKRVATCLRFYVFRERLKEKCTARGVNYKCVNESYTSKMCSICGNEKNNLGRNEVYNCEKCKTVIGRDTNGARNIYCKALI